MAAAAASLGQSDYAGTGVQHLQHTCRTTGMIESRQAFTDAPRAVVLVSAAQVFAVPPGQEPLFAQMLQATHPQLYANLAAQAAAAQATAAQAVSCRLCRLSELQCALPGIGWCRSYT
jgi:hypothetical protein